MLPNIKITSEQMQQGLHPRQVQTCQLHLAEAHQLPGIQDPWQQFYGEHCVCQQFLFSRPRVENQ